MVKVLLIAPYLQCKNLADEVFAGFGDRSISLQAIYAVGVKFKLSEIKQAFELADKDETAIKIVLRP